MNKIQVKKRISLTGHKAPIYRIATLGETSFLSFGADGVIVKWDLEQQVSSPLLKVRNPIFTGFSVGSAIFFGENGVGIHQFLADNPSEIMSSTNYSNQLFDIGILEGKWIGAFADGFLNIYSDKLVLEKSQRISERNLRAIAINNEEVAIGGSDNLVKILNISTFAVKQVLNAHTSSVFALAYHPSMKYLVSASRDASIKVWDCEANYELREDIAAHLYAVNHIAFSHDGKLFATASMDRTIKIWDAYSFRLLKVIDEQRYGGHKSSVNRLLWMKYQNLLVSCSDDRAISVWEINEVK